MNVHPVKLAYNGVLIERPCVNCDTVDIHFEGKCNSGLCQYVFSGDASQTPGPCNLPRFGNRPELNHDRQYIHSWVAPTYYPADIEFPPRQYHYIRSAVEKAFDAILDCVRREGQPELYTIDLFRDYQKLIRKQPQRFVWKLRAHGCGTDLYVPYETIFRVHGDRFFLYDSETHGPLGDFPEVDFNTASTVLHFWYKVETTKARALAAGESIVEQVVAEIEKRADDVDHSESGTLFPNEHKFSSFHDALISRITPILSGLEGE